MTYYRRKRDPRREQFLQLFSRLIILLQKSYDEKKLRDGLTMETLAERLGVSKSRVSKILNGHSNMTLETLSNMAFELERDVDITLPAFNCNLTSTSPPIFTYIVSNETKGGWVFNSCQNLDFESQDTHEEIPTCFKPATGIATETKNIPFDLGSLEIKECAVN